MHHITQGGRRGGCRLLAWIALLGMATLLTGCKSDEQSNKITYSNAEASDDLFQRGANRPPNPETLYRLGRLLAAQGKDDQAYGVLRNSIERFPDHLPSYIELAQLQTRQRKTEAAVATLEAALRISPHDPVVLNDMGMVWMLRNDYQRALDYFSRAAANSPDDARYKANMALATGMLGRYDEAFSLYEQIMRPEHAHYNVAIVAEARNDMPKANEEYAKAKALDGSLKRKPKEE